MKIYFCKMWIILWALCIAFALLAGSGIGPATLVDLMFGMMSICFFCGGIAAAVTSVVFASKDWEKHNEEPK